jgi:hypothetical protein
VRADPQLLRPIQHRSAKTQGDLMVIRVRSALVEAPTVRNWRGSSPRPRSTSRVLTPPALARMKIAAYNLHLHSAPFSRALVTHMK